jgi:RHS repeat-associated protein
MHFDDNDNLVATNRRESGTFESGSASVYDERNRVRQSVELEAEFTGSGTPTGKFTSVLYDKNSNRTRVWNPNKVPSVGTTDNTHSTGYVYDSRQRLHQVLEVNDSGNDVVVMEIEYYEDNSRQFVKTQKPIVGGLITTQEFTYTVRKELLEVKDALGKITKYEEYDQNGNLKKVRDPHNKLVEYTYDNMDRLETEIQYAGSLNIVTSYTYDENSNRKTVTVFNPATGGNNATYTFFYDQADRMERMEYPVAAHNEVWTYTAHGEVETHKDANGKVVTYGYDDLGRLTSEAHGSPFGITIDRTYDASGNLETVTDGTTMIVYTWSALNRLDAVSWTVSGALVKSLSYEYFDSGHRKKMTAPEGFELNYEYDQNDRLEFLKVGAVTYGAWTYDDGGRKESLTLNNGSVVTWTYTDRDEIFEVKTISSTAAVLAHYIYGYNDKGERTSQQRAHLGETIAYGYDDAGRLTSETSTGSTVMGAVLSVPARNLTWQYDKAGNRTVQTRGAEVCTYAYDSENRLQTEVCQDVCSGIPVVSSTAPGRNPAVLVDDDTTDSPAPPKCWQNNTSTPGLIFAGVDCGAATTFRKVTFFIPTAGGPGTTGMQRFKVQVGNGIVFVDAVPTVVTGAQASPTPGWLQTKTPTQHEVSVEFTPLVGTMIRIVMDLGPSLFPTRMRVNEIQVTAQLHVIAYTYDSNGNQKTRTKSVTSGAVSAETYGYDYANRLTSYVLVTGMAVTANFTYVFSPTGDRVAKHDVLLNTTEWYLFDGSDTVKDYSQAGAGALSLATSYVQPATIDSKIARISGSDVHYYVPDALGSVTHLLNASQAIVNSEATDAWGNVVAESSLVADRHGFTQREKDDESSLMHYRARSYDPRIGRLIQPDRLFDMSCGRSFGYAGNRPTLNVDPSGRFDFPIHEEISNDGLADSAVAPGVRRWIAAQSMAPDLRSTLSLGKAAAKYTQDDIELLINLPGRKFFPERTFMDWNELHFDDLYNTAAIKQHWDELEQKLEKIAKAVNDSSGMANDQKLIVLSTTLGHALHAVQDFYSHSNWIERSLEFGTKPGDIPTWHADLWFERHIHLLRITHPDKQIFTGTFLGEKAPKGHPHHENLNKDNPSRGKNHHVARRLATAASKEWLAILMGHIKDPALKRLFQTPGGRLNEFMGTRAAEGSAAASAFSKHIFGVGK